MIVMASRSSTTARVSRKVRSALGRWVLITARTARAKAMSVAVGIAQPRSAPSPAPRLTSDVEQRRHRHAADRRGDRQRRPARVAQVAGDELPLELQAGDEEEDRQQAVGGPGAQGQVQVQRLRADLGVPQRRVAGRPGRVGPDQREHGAGRAAGRRRRSPCAGPRRSGWSRGQEPRANRRGGAGHGRLRGGVGQDVADQTSRRTGSDPTGRAAPGPAP